MMLARCLAPFITAGMAALASGQTPGWNGPTSGLLFDPPTKSLRRVSGFLGAAQLSKPVLEDLAWASVAPNGQRALVKATSGEVAWLEGLERSEFSSSPMPISGSSPLLARWNSNSSAIRVFSAECSCFVTLARDPAGMPSQAGEPQFFDLSAGGVQDFYWRDSQTVVATEKGLFELNTGEQSRPLLPSGSDVSYLLDASGKAWGVRGTSGEILEVVLRKNGTAELKLVATEPDYFTDLAAIASMPGAILAADRKTRAIYRIDLASGLTTKVCDLEAAPSRLTPLGDGPSWLLGDRSLIGEPIFVLDGASTPRVVFVPGGDQL
jgi:hypothetical protein